MKDTLGIIQVGPDPISPVERAMLSLAKDVTGDIVIVDKWHSQARIDGEIMDLKPLPPDLLQFANNPAPAAPPAPPVADVTQNRLRRRRAQFQPSGYIQYRREELKTHLARLEEEKAREKRKRKAIEKQKKRARGRG